MVENISRRKRIRGINSLIKQIEQAIQQWLMKQSGLSYSVKHQGANLIVTLGHEENRVVTMRSRQAPPDLLDEVKRKINDLFRKLQEDYRHTIRRTHDRGSHMVCSLATG